MNDLERAIVKTLAYADLFNQALTTEQLRRCLVGMKMTNEQLEKVERDEVRNVRYEVWNGIWALQGRRELFELKTQQLQTTSQKLQTVKRYAWLFALLPWVKLVAVSGSVAGGSPEVDDDIDLVVVTSKGRMWLSRFLLTGVLTLLGKRRKPTDDPGRVNNKLCLNMWLSEDHLASNHQDMYVANELAHMVPLLNRDEMYERYVQANVWVKEILPNFLNEELRIKNYANGGSRLLNWLDGCLEKWQRGRMRSVTKEVIQDNLLMFHPRDYRSEILQRYKQQLKQYGVDE